MKPTVVRQCGFMEHYSTARHNLGFYRGIASSCQYVVSRKWLQGRAVQQVVQDALARLILRLGGLQVGIIDEDTNKASFVRVASIDLRDFIEWRTVDKADPALYDEEVLQAIKDRLEQLWPDVASRPPWKLLVVQNTSLDAEDTVLDMIFAHHHAIADGKSTTVFHTELLKELDNSSGPPPELKGHILTLDKPPIVAPSQEILVDLKISWSFLIRTLWNEFGPSWLKPLPPPAPWTGRTVAVKPNVLHLRLLTINAKTVQPLVKACRDHDTSLSGLIHIMLLVSLSRRVPVHVASSFAGETPMSLLPWARPPPGADLDLTTVLTDLTTGTNKRWGAAVVEELRSRSGRGDAGGEEQLVWPLAAAWREEMKAKVATLPNDDIVGMMQYISNFNAWFLEKVGKPRSGTWALSNIGTIKGKSVEGITGAWRITRALFSQPVHVTGPAFAVNVVSVEGGPVNMVFSWQDGVVNDSLIEGAVHDAHTWLQEFEKTGGFGMFTGSK